jgi:hypothetical protein
MDKSRENELFRNATPYRRCPNGSNRGEPSKEKNAGAYSNKFHAFLV